MSIAAFIIELQAGRLDPEHVLNALEPGDRDALHALLAHRKMAAGDFMLIALALFALRSADAAWDEAVRTAALGENGQVALLGRILMDVAKVFEVERLLPRARSVPMKSEHALETP